MKLVKKESLLFYLIIAAYLIYSVLFIYRSSFVVSGERYFVLFDDAMISMRYAKNFASGEGLVWNPGGEKIEGYSNPLWVVFMAGFHLLPIPSSKISLFVQISGAIFLTANLFVVRKIGSLLSKDWLVPIFAVLLTAFYAPLNNWGLLGMEVSALAFITSLSVWMVLKFLKEGDFSPWLFVLLGLATLIRIDMVVPYILILCFLLVTLPSRRPQILIWGIALLGLFLGGQTIFRLLYYGNPLPNTYYLKVEGYSLLNRVGHGLYVLFLFGWNFNWILFLLPLVILFFRQDAEVILLLLLILGQFVYSVYVGGDAWEHKGGSNRYISIVMPLFFILFANVLVLIRDLAAGGVGKRKGRYQFVPNLIMVLFILVTMVNTNILVDFKSLDRWILSMNPEFVRGNQRYVRIALDLKEITSPQAKVAVVSAGAIPYFSDRYAIDLLGKNDPVVANLLPRNTSAITNLDLYRPGHMKWDYDYSVGKLDPDIIVQVWGPKEEIRPYLMTEYITGRVLNSNGIYYYIRKDSSNILWENVEIKP
ncbi:MAG: hypothetical protein ACK2U3_06445 [Anaerolineales bacterium]